MAIGILALAGVQAASASAPTTVQQTICDYNGDHRLDTCAGESYLDRATELCPPSICPDPQPVDPRSPLFDIVQVSDFQTVDEESPARVECTDRPSCATLLGFFTGDGLNAAYRPQESLGLQASNAMIGTLNEVTSPISSRPPQLSIVTGDNADSLEQLETDWYIQVLDGRQVITPDSGDPSYAPSGCTPSSYPSRRYQGVRGNHATPTWGARNYWEPDNSNDGPGYTPNASQNQQDVGRTVAVRDYPGILDRAQDSFTATGLNFPWLAVFGNHDALWQGTLTAGQFDVLRVAVPAATFGWYNAIRRPDDCKKDLNGNGHIDGDETVQPDPRRNFLTRQQWIARHFGSSVPGVPGPDGHGFDSPSSDRGYYSRQLVAGWRLIGLDSVNREGLHNGIVRDGSLGQDDQWGWLVGELSSARQRGERAIVYAHHSLRTMNNTDSSGWQDQHCGLIDSPAWPQPGARQCADLGTESLESLFCRTGVVALYVAGHEHVNDVEARNRSDCANPFWEITTASEIDWPIQSRMIEAFVNRDRSISIYGTLIDADVPPDPGNSPNLGDPQALASIAREVAYNDFQGRTGRDGATADARGERRDRNVHLVLPPPPVTVDRDCDGRPGLGIHDFSFRAPDSTFAYDYSGIRMELTACDTQIRNAESYEAGGSGSQFTRFDFSMPPGVTYNTSTPPAQGSYVGRARINVLTWRGNPQEPVFLPNLSLTLRTSASSNCPPGALACFAGQVTAGSMSGHNFSWLSGSPGGPLALTFGELHNDSYPSSPAGVTKLAELSFCAFAGSATDTVCGQRSSAFLFRNGMPGETYYDYANCESTGTCPVDPPGGTASGRYRYLATATTRDGRTTAPTYANYGWDCNPAWRDNGCRPPQPRGAGRGKPAKPKRPPSKPILPGGR